MKFISQSDYAPLEGNLIYKSKEYSFDFEIKDHAKLNDRIGDYGGQTSILIGTLNLEISTHSKYLLYVWGYHPNLSWKPKSLLVPSYIPGSVKLLQKDAFIPGISVHLEGDEQWETYHDRDTGWICLTPKQALLTNQHIEIATGIVISISDTSVQALWLHPAHNDAQP